MYLLGVRNHMKRGDGKSSSREKFETEREREHSDDTYKL